MKPGVRMLLASMASLMGSSLSPEQKQEEAIKLNRYAGGALFSQSPIPQRRAKSQNKRRKLYRSSGHPKNARRKQK